MTFRALGILTLLPLLLVACADKGGGVSDGSVVKPAALEGNEWTLDRASISSLSAGAPPDASVTIAFDKGRASGKAACNSYGGGYQAGNDGSLSFGTFALTMMACAEPLMSLESAYMDALGKMTTFTVGDSLVLTGDGVSLTYGATPAPEALPLTGTVWSLTSIAEGDAVSSVLADSKTTATFDASGSTVAGSAGCNTYNGSYTEGGNGALSFSALASTKMMCADDVMAQETAFLAAMGTVASYQIEGAQLQLLDDSGAMLLGFDGA